MQDKLVFITLAILFASASVLSKRITLKRRRRAEGPRSPDFAVVALTHVPYEYYGHVTIGSPKDNEEEQVFTVLFDTGSPHLWVTSVGACFNSDCNGKTYKGFNGSKSSTYNKLDLPFEITYLDKTDVKGNLAKDNLKLGSGDNQIVIEDQIFGEAVNITGVFNNADGIFGLSFKLKNYMAGDPDPPFISIAKHLNIQPVLGVYLNKQFDENAGGEIIFGGVDKELIEGEINFHNVVRILDYGWSILGHNRFWYIKLDKISIIQDGETQTVYLTQNILALIDTGTNHITGPKIIFDKMNAFLFKDVYFHFDEIYSFPCYYGWKYMPDVVFTIDGIDYPLSPEDYIWPDNMSVKCRSGLIPHTKENNILLGTLFMEKYYTIFDMESKRVGFSKAKHQQHWKEKIGL